MDRYPTNFAMFYPQTTEIQSFKVEYFSARALKFQQCGVMICNISANFGIYLCGINYLCAKFHHNMTINDGINCNGLAKLQRNVL